MFNQLQPQQQRYAAPPPPQQQQPIGVKRNHELMMLLLQQQQLLAANNNIATYNPLVQQAAVASVTPAPVVAAPTGIPSIYSMQPLQAPTSQQPRSPAAPRDDMVSLGMSLMARKARKRGGEIKVPLEVLSYMGGGPKKRAAIALSPTATKPTALAVPMAVPIYPPPPKKSPICSVDSNIMVNILSFLKPTETLDVMTMPLSKDWASNVTRQDEDIWSVLCRSEPFYDKEADKADSSSDEEEEDANPFSTEAQLRNVLGKSRIRYTKFVRCLRYLERIEQDASKGSKSPSVNDNGKAVPAKSFSRRDAGSLESFLARAKALTDKSKKPAPVPSFAAAPKLGGGGGGIRFGGGGIGLGGGIGRKKAAAPSFLGGVGRKKGATCNMTAEDIAQVCAMVRGGGGGGAVTTTKASKMGGAGITGGAIGVTDNGTKMGDASIGGGTMDKKKEEGGGVRYGQSMITPRLLGASSLGDAGSVQLPWSCAIYSIVNWMVTFPRVEGIQTACLKVLPALLEDDAQRRTAQQAGLMDICLREMTCFPDSAQLHTAAMHAMVLLTRPMGGREGMSFRGNMNVTSVGESGIDILLASMKRFQEYADLQVVGCWSLVNIALQPTQKQWLVQRGGLESLTDAMKAHPKSEQVQFRALFALINLVIPSSRLNNTEASPVISSGGPTEEEMLDKMVSTIIELVLASMKNFCSSKSILNRACLVLHNLSLSPAYHRALLQDATCYRMLEWCLDQFQCKDPVLQQGAANALHRLQLTLGGDAHLRARFAAALQAAGRDLPGCSDAASVDSLDRRLTEEQFLLSDSDYSSSEEESGAEESEPESDSED